MILSKKQKIQENQYRFPYHYIPHDRIYQTRELSWGYEYLSYIQFLINKVKTYKFKYLLDVGCGDGRFLFELKKYYDPAKLYGIDYSEKAIKYAKIFNPKVNIIHGNIKNRNIINKKFEIITLIETLEHIPPQDIQNFIKAIYFHLKNKGLFILTVPSQNVKKNPKHYQHFTTNSIKKILKPFFNIKKIYYLNRIRSYWQVKLLSSILTNEVFSLNYKPLLKRIYKYYGNNLLIVKENTCRRICIFAEKNK